MARVLTGCQLALDPVDQSELPEEPAKVQVGDGQVPQDADRLHHKLLLATGVE